MILIWVPWTYYEPEHILHREEDDGNVIDAVDHEHQVHDVGPIPSLLLIYNLARSVSGPRVGIKLTGLFHK